jgi:hypothetical protein
LEVLASCNFNILGAALIEKGDPISAQQVLIEVIAGPKVVIDSIRPYALNALGVLSSLEVLIFALS